MARRRRRGRRPVRHVTHYPYYGVPYYDPRLAYQEPSEPQIVVLEDKKKSRDGYEPHFAIDGRRLNISLHWPTIAGTLFVAYLLWGRR